MVLSRPTRHSRTNTKQRCPFHYRELECKSRKSRDIRSNSQIWSCSTNWRRTKASRILSREHTCHKTPSSENTREVSRHGHYQMVNPKIRLIIFFVAKHREALYANQKQELTVAQIKNSLWQNSYVIWRK